MNFLYWTWSLIEVYSAKTFRFSNRTTLPLRHLAEWGPYADAYKNRLGTEYLLLRPNYIKQEKITKNPTHETKCAMFVLKMCWRKSLPIQHSIFALDQLPFLSSATLKGNCQYNCRNCCSFQIFSSFQQLWNWLRRLNYWIFSLLQVLSSSVLWCM